MTGPATNVSSVRWHAGRAIRALGFGLTLILLLAGAAAFLFWNADTVVRTEAVTATAPEAGRGRVTLYADERLFTLMAALNAAGYNDENNEKGMSPVRQRVRSQLAARNIPSLLRLRLYFRAHPSQYVAWVLQRGEPPLFGRAVTQWSIDGVPAFAFWGLDSALADFYREADIASLWREVEPDYAREIARERPIVNPAVDAAFDYVRVKKEDTAPIIVLPNLMDAYWRGYGPKVGDTSYIVLGPSDTPNPSLIQHEALHPIVNPLVAANLDVIEPDKANQLYSMLRTRVSSSYPLWETILDESVIRAIGLRLLAPADRPAYLAQQESQGFVLTRPLAEKLQEYEKSDESFPQFMRALLQSLNDIDLRDLSAP